MTFSWRLRSDPSRNRNARARLSLMPHHARICQICLVLLACLAFSQPVAAEKRIALIIGNDAYEHVAPLAKAVNDARAVAKSVQALGFQTIIAENLTRNAMSRAFLTLDETIEKGDTVLFFFAGHGIEVAGQNYLLPTDIPAAKPGQENLIRDAAFRANGIVERLQEKGARTAILVLDACRDNPFPKSGTRSVGVTRGLARMSPPEGVFVLYSAGANQAALDRLSDNDQNNNSVFTREFLKSVTTPGLSLIDIAKRTQVSVRKLAQSIGHAQTPAYYDQIIGDVYLAGKGKAPTTQDAPKNPDLVAKIAKPGKGTLSRIQADRTLPADEQSLMANSLAALSKTANPVSAPNRPEQFYHNARLFEARGNALAARKAYMALARFDIDFIDPHLRLARLLRVQDGRAGAREIYSELREDAKAPAVELIYATLFTGAKRRQKIESFLKKHKTYGPAYYLLAQEYSEDRLGDQSLADKRKQYALLGKFLQAEEDGTLLPHFLDQSELGKWLERARRDHRILRPLATRNLKPNVSFMRHNAGWMANISVPEVATSLSYRIGETGDFKHTGYLNAIDPRTGKQMPRPNFELPASAQSQPIYVAYIDGSGNEAGPFKILFDPSFQLKNGQKNILEQLKTGWLSFRDYNGKFLLYTSHLQSYACGIREGYYGLDTDTPDRKLTIQACNPKNPHAVSPNTKIYFTIPKGTKKVAVKLTYFDGSQSEVVYFNTRP